MEVLCLLADAIMALILKATLDAPETWAFVTYSSQYQ